MSWISRFANLFRQDRLDREIAEDLHSHLAEAPSTLVRSDPPF